MSSEYVFAPSIDRSLRDAYAALCDGEYQVAADVLQTILLHVDAMTFNDARMPSAPDLHRLLLTAWCHIMRKDAHAAHNIIRDLHYRFSGFPCFLGFLGSR